MELRIGLKFSQHALQRFVQRVLGNKSWSLTKINNYINAHRAELVHDFLNLINESSVLHCDLYNEERQQIQDYLIKGNFIIVLSHGGKNVITIYEALMDRNNIENAKQVRRKIKKVKQNNFKMTKLNSEKRKLDKDIYALKYLKELDTEGIYFNEEMLEKKIKEAQFLTSRIKHLRKHSLSLVLEIVNGHRDVYEEENFLRNMQEEIENCIL